ncbi:hypothetical protein ACIQM4_16010 [Streptomyces sp. NPDC091272]|uniref:hypothetical protein n=1 Tax=Streptomyces sp. NPDC091272 TaxID=3365981 RepID=UPI00382601F7
MTYESGNDGRERAADGTAPRTPTPSERGAEAELDALHDPVQAQANQRGRSARDFGVTGAGASDEIGPLRRPPEGSDAAQGRQPGQERQAPPVPPVQAPAAGGGRGGAGTPAAGKDGRGTDGRGTDGLGTDAMNTDRIGSDRGGDHLGADRAGTGRAGAGLGADRTGAGQDRAGAGHLDAPAGGAVAGARGEQHPGSATAHQPGVGAQLLPHGERDKLGLRLQQAVNQFVDEPRRAVEEADHVLEEATRHVAETLAEHRRSLRGAWETKDRETETEELRVALRKYREVTERLLQM